MKSTVIVLLHLVAALTLRAEIAVGESLEWMADTNAAIGIYQVTAVHKAPAPVSGPDVFPTVPLTFELSFRLKENLKGTPPDSCKSTYSIPSLEGSLPPSVAIGDRFLLFLNFIIADNRNSARIDRLINLSNPRYGDARSSAITCKFEVPADDEQILAVARERLKAHPGTMPNERYKQKFWVQLRGDEPAYRVLYNGSACYLLVPEDLKPVKSDK